jgi:hypothetical protein
LKQVDTTSSTTTRQQHPKQQQTDNSPAMVTGRFMERAARPMDVAMVKGTANQQRPPNR